MRQRRLNIAGMEKQGSQEKWIVTQTLNTFEKFIQKMKQGKETGMNSSVQLVQT